ncbi:LOW QUALITY PROTEIN: uncharacterized protein Dwil_GK20807 [Drosophila willistoni]|uniref:RING-type E3 ubiquitin transferase n=1 Tax=Drosophila willistoni TaxID=7260 RepID=B4MX75_DROWI|nr:roquin-1 [Drosophila willistoni]EDW76908.2 LOW QUALITY PROTEIN: uncharacterized protein Dwil_GK20807 [Drosophila willistoni]
MPIQAPSWTDFLNCPICCKEFAASQRSPISLGCGHTVCKLCLTSLYNRQCPFDQTYIVTDIDNLPINNALLQLVAKGGLATKESYSLDLDQSPPPPPSVQKLDAEQLKCYKLGKKCIEDLALHLKSFLNLNVNNLLTRPMQRKLVTLVNCQLMEDEGRVRALRAARSLGERTVTELILQHQNPQQLSSNLWAAVRTRGCQFLGPAMQEEVLKLVLLALEEGSALSRKVLVMFVVQRLEPHFPQASKTSIGHVVQLLYRASCFKVSKREADSSLMQLKEEFRSYDALRREHDAQIVQIATEAGLRIAPEQWSSLLYGDINHKSHMQSIIDKLQTPSSFSQSVQELVIALQRTSDPAKLANLHQHLLNLANIDPLVEVAGWEDVAQALDAVRQAVMGLVNFLQHHGIRKPQEGSNGGGGVANISNPKYKISLCRDLNVRRVCPRGASCTFAHSQEEVERYRARHRGKSLKALPPGPLPPIAMNKKSPLGHEGADGPNPSGLGMNLSPMHYMPSPRGYPPMDGPLASPAAQPPMMPLGHTLGRQLNGGIMLPRGNYESRFPPAYGPPTTRNPPPLREYPNPQNRTNPPNYNMPPPPPPLPTDLYHHSTPANYYNNNNNNHKELAGLHPWNHEAYQQQPSTKTSSNPSRTLSIDTSFYEKKPPSHLDDTGADIGDVLPLPPPNLYTTSRQHNNNNINTNNNSHNNSNHNNNTSSLLFWNNPNKETANFVRSDSILDDDATTFDVPTGSSSIHSLYGPICPKSSTVNSNTTNTNWNNWLLLDQQDQHQHQHQHHQQIKSNLKTNDLGYNFQVDGNENINAIKNSGPGDNMFMWDNDVNVNASNSSSSSATIAWSNCDTMSNHNERLKQQQQLLVRKPQLMSEDSFEGGIDSCMMRQLEKNLVDIVDPDDSGIKVD